MRVTPIILVLALAAAAQADQLAYLDKEVAAQAAKRIEVGAPMVEWVSHMADSNPKLVRVDAVRVAHTGYETYYEVIVKSRLIAERVDGEWKRVQKAKPTEGGIDLAYAYQLVALPPFHKQQQGEAKHPADRTFLNMARSLKLEAEIEHETIAVPTEAIGFWNLVGNKAIDIMGDAMRKMIQKWVAEGADEDELLNDLEQQQQKQRGQGVVGRLDADKKPAKKKARKQVTEPEQRTEQRTEQRRGRPIQIDRPLGE